MRWSAAIAAGMALLLGSSAAQAADADDGVIEWNWGDAQFLCVVPFWTSLHHVLWAHAFVDVDENTGAAPAWGVPHVVRDAAPWKEAVQWYEEHLADSSLNRTAAMRRLDLTLAPLAADEPPRLDNHPQLAERLIAAAPLYREHAWPAHQAASWDWIARLEAVNNRFGRAMAARLAAIYQRPWPDEPIIVSFLPYANWAGAYTTFPPHVRFAPDRRHADDGLLFEIFWHESAHVLEGLDGAIRAPLLAAGAEDHDLDARGLAHAILFFTCGELVREIGAADDEYAPYADRHGLYNGRWAPFIGPIRRHWPAYMRGEIGLNEAARRIVGDLSGDAPQREKAPGPAVTPAQPKDSASGSPDPSSSSSS